MHPIQRFLLITFTGVMICSCASNSPEKEQENYDIVIYGATSGGIAAAIQASRMGKSVVLIEPSQRIGGLTTGGLGQTDIGNKFAIGGISREFYQQIRKYYQDSSHWKWQVASEYQDGGQTRTSAKEDAMWTFEPSAALSVYQDMLKNGKVDLVMQESLDRQGGVIKEGTDITTIQMKSGRAFGGKMFIDATYEGDLMAAAGVSYIVGREANSLYGETYNGVQLMEGHQLPDGIDPYQKKGDPESGLLWGISQNVLAQQGRGDSLVQAYNFRICLTNAEENSISISRPKGYDSTRYTLLARLIQAQPIKQSLNDYFIWSSMPNRKTDINNRGGFSTDMINHSHAYPGASDEDRHRIFTEHVAYTKGLLYFFAHDPRVPEALREEMQRWGYPKDEYEQSNYWSPQLYVREARRLIGAYVMTQANCVGEKTVSDPVGLAAYTMDSHNCQRIVIDGQVKNEGNVEVGGFPPYPISYRAIIPKKEEVSNLLVPVCLSASHIAFGSIRMEPVFMVLGQSAATAASQAIDRSCSVQELPYAPLKAQLMKDQMVLKP